MAYFSTEPAPERRNPTGKAFKIMDYRKVKCAHFEKPTGGRGQEGIR
ncbi:MAG: hypothetical protein WCK77_21270 [Verrucomicrobiota bacterium]